MLRLLALVLITGGAAIAAEPAGVREDALELEALVNQKYAYLERLPNGRFEVTEKLRGEAAMVDTPLWKGMQPEAKMDMMKGLAGLYPAGVLGKPDDIANMLLTLAANPYATGAVVTLDGGASLV